MVKEMNTAEFNLAIKGDKTVFVDFWAVWCGPCRMLAPVIDELSEEFAETAVFGKVNVDEESDLAQQYGIMSIPCVMAFKNGELVDKNVGFVPKAALKAFIERNI